MTPEAINQIALIAYAGVLTIVSTALHLDRMRHRDGAVYLANKLRAADLRIANLTADCLDAQTRASFAEFKLGAGHDPRDIAPLFAGATENIFLSEKLVAALRHGSK